MRLILAGMLIVTGSALRAMEASEQNMTDITNDFEEKCGISHQASFTPQEQEKLQIIYQKREQEKQFLLERLKQKIAQEEILVFEVAVHFQDLTQFANRDYLLRKTITAQLNAQKLVPCTLLIHHSHLPAFMQDPLIKECRNVSADSIASELKWYVFRDYNESILQPHKLKKVTLLKNPKQQD